MKFVHNVLGGDTNGTDEELGLLLNYDINEGMKLALCVVVLNSIRDMRMGVSYGKTIDLTLVLRALPPTWGRSKSTPNGASLSFKSALMAWIYNGGNIDQPSGVKELESPGKSGGVPVGVEFLVYIRHRQ